MAKKRAKATTTTNTTLASISTNCSAKQPKHMVHGIPEPSDDDLVDFRGLAILPRCYSSLLERACIGHPDLALCTKRSLRWREFAYETLGELLFFLTSTRRKEMVNKAYEHLQILWEEAQGLGFDLSWLTPIVNSCLALDSKNSDVDDTSAKMEALRSIRTPYIVKWQHLQCKWLMLIKDLLLSRRHFNVQKKNMSAFCLQACECEGLGIRNVWLIWRKIMFWVLTRYNCYCILIRLLCRNKYRFISLALMFVLSI